MCFQFAIAAFVSAIIIVVTGQGSLSQSFTTGDATVGALNFASMNCSIFAMKRVSFPFVVLAKSAKVIPVILVGTLRGVYSPTTKQYLIAVFISVGLMIFNLNKILNNKQDHEQSNSEFLIGLFLVLMSLSFDGLTQTQTDKQHKSTKRDFAYPGMLSNNVVGLVLSLGMYSYSVLVHGDTTHS
jgi:adenosine 3'-phospho 5'-phosphosulfate transporter B2